MKRAIINYSGSKGSSGTHQKIINEMPPHEVYIETHLGGGFILLKKKPASKNFGIDIDKEVINQWEDFKKSEKLEGVLFYENDAIEWLKEYSAKNGFSGNELIYSDPPYLHETRKDKNLYKHEYSHSDHVKLLKYLKTLPCKIIISGYRSKLYDEMLAGWRSLDFEAMTRQGVRTETLWMNYDEPELLHDYRFFGNDFREREKIKRKAKRWHERFLKLEPKERQAINAVLRGIELPKGKAGPKFKNE